MTTDAVSPLAEVLKSIVGLQAESREHLLSTADAVLRTEDLDEIPVHKYILAAW